MLRKICLGALAMGAMISAQEYTTPHAECTRFGANSQRFVPNAHRGAVSALTNQVTAQLPAMPSMSTSQPDTTNVNDIDQYIFAALQSANVAPAPPTTDYEFIRRVTLDLTGRIPTPARVMSFVASTSATKRADLVNELMAAPEWTDKWTMFLGDLYQNNSQNAQIRRFPLGVKAFNDYVRAALNGNKPYDQMARELITAAGTNSYDAGELNFVVGGVVTGGPVQDIFDQQTANVFDVFMGISHVNCLLCHDGRGHLTSLSLWGSQTTRYQAWQLSSFLSHTLASRTPVNGAVNNNPYYWGLTDDSPRARTDYALNTTTGNRPARQPSGSEKTVAPVYIFNGNAPKPGDNYRTALATQITGDFQFARATVNRFWAYFFGVGLVDPPDQFDPARLDPDNPPPDPWTLQPSNPRLLNALAQDFINNKYDLKWLMKAIVNSRAYQLSSRYDGTYDAAWDTLYARHFVRRLWAEEMHDAVAQSSNILPTYAVASNGTLTWAMQFPEPLDTPTARNAVTPLLDAFLRGNRDDQARSGEGSISQALGLMNDPFVMSRTKSNGPATSLLVKNLNLSNTQLVNTLFLAVLSRVPTADEMTQAITMLSTGNHSLQAENLLWSLYNKVDFVFNY